MRLLSLALICFSFSALQLNAGEPEIEAPGYLKYQGAIVRGDTAVSKLHLVFTGHKYAEGGLLIRKVLKKHGVPAHFFFTGDFYRNPKHKRLIKLLKEDGHYLGAHSDKHLLYASWEDRDSLLVNQQQFNADLISNYEELARFGIRKQDAPLFLPPYEWYNERICEWTESLGLTMINYSSGTLSTADYTTPDLGTRYRPSTVIYESILDYEETSENGLNGFILLLHIGTHPDRTDKFFNHLDALLLELKTGGYEFSLMTGEAWNHRGKQQ